MEEEKIDPSLDLYAISGDPLYKRHLLVLPVETRRLLERKADLECTIEMLDLRVRMSRIVNTESMAEGDISVSTPVNETVTDIVGDDLAKTDAGFSVQPNVGQDNLLSVDAFFSRPISIYSTSIPLDTHLNLRLAIWDLYSMEPSVRAKFRNYSFFSGDLCLRIAITGTPFHYGKALISYQAYAPQNDNITSHLTNVGFDGGLRPLFLNYLSQAHGSSVIDFRGNRPVDIRCPFISPKGAHRLFNTSAAVLASATSYSDFLDAGDLFLYSINPPLAVSASPTNIYLQIYAWMENVTLGPPSATQIAIATESGDERKTGPVQRVCSTAATVSNALSSIPGISTLAKASSMAFSGMAGVAAWFGWSRPNVLDDPKYMKNRPYASAAYTIGVDTADKITLDPLQELSVDPRICGTSEDEMSVAFLSNVESYLTTFEWNTGDTPLASAIWRTKVTPSLDTYYGSGGVAYHQPTALSFASLPFSYWRGTIKFRLEVVCSQFHRGKLAIGWEPNILQAPLFDTKYFLNKNYVKIIDIQETQDVEFCVNYASPYIWLEIQDPTPYTIHSSYFVADGQMKNNGFLYVVPFTELQSPLNIPINVNVYVSGEDMQFNRYDPRYLPTKRKVLTESGRESSSPEVSFTCLELNPAVSDSATTSDVCFGEQPLSLRSLLKRYTTFALSSGAVSAAAHDSIKYTRPFYPPYSPVYSTVAAQDSNPTLFRTILPAYLGLKGGMRRRFRLWVSGDNPGLQACANVGLASADASYVSAIPSATYTTPFRMIGLGANTFIPHTNGGVEVETPYYSPNLFQFAFKLDGLGTVDSNEMFSTWLKNIYVQFDSTAVTGTLYFSDEYATAEDFNLMRFNGAPFYTE